MPGVVGGADGVGTAAEVRGAEVGAVDEGGWAGVGVLSLAQVSWWWGCLGVGGVGEVVLESEWEGGEEGLEGDVGELEGGGCGGQEEGGGEEGGAHCLKGGGWWWVVLRVRGGL